MRVSRTFFRLGVIGITTLVGVGCTCTKPPAPPEPKNHIQVGRYQVTDQEIRLRQKIEKLYFPNEDSDALARKNLVEAFVYAEILASHGQPITPDQLDQEARRIRSTTQAPAQLKRVEEIFDGDEEAFRRVFVLPVLAERKVYTDLFASSGTIHKKAFVEADRFLKDARANPSQFRALASKSGGELSHFTVSRTRGVLPENPDSRFDMGIIEMGHPNAQSEEFKRANPGYVEEDADRWIREVLRPLKRKGIHNKVIEWEDKLMVVRLRDRHGGTYKVDSVSFKKVSFDTWLKQERSKIKIVRKVTVPGS